MADASEKKGTAAAEADPAAARGPDMHDLLRDLALLLDAQPFVGGTP